MEALLIHVFIWDESGRELEEAGQLTAASGGGCGRRRRREVWDVGVLETRTTQNLQHSCSFFLFSDWICVTAL